MARAVADASELVEAVRWASQRGWAPATGGNFSARISPKRVAITASGVDKGALQAEDLLTLSLKGKTVQAADGLRPSAETPLHLCLYRLSPQIGCVLHTHSVAATVLSELAEEPVLRIRGLEMQKSLAGQSTHDGTVELAVFDNTQDLHALAAEVEARWPLSWGLLVRGHGLYAWGRTVGEARRHLEGLEFLLAVQLERVRLGQPLERAESRRPHNSVSAVLVDIEGTTTALSFVHEVLFPYAREVLPDWVRQHARKKRVQQVLRDVRRELGQPRASLDKCVGALQDWMAADAKVTPLKTLQGWVWEEGYAQGAFRGHVYPDAAAGLRRWHDLGLALYVYSSGSVQAQKLLFGYSTEGDLTSLFSGYFDTTTGHKREQASYEAIARTTGHDPEELVFLSDVVDELDAAAAAGLRTVQLAREGQATAFHPVADSFDTIHPLELP